MDDVAEIDEVDWLLVPCPRCGRYELGFWPGAEHPYECYECGWRAQTLLPA